MNELLAKYIELKEIILKSKKFHIQKDFHLFVLLEEITNSIQIELLKSKEK